jgi:adenine deaminase
MAAAANAVIAAGGGVAVVRGNELLASIDLPVAGILSPLPSDQVAAKQRDVLDAAHSIGLPVGTLTQPLLQVMAASLACLPGPHVTDLGVIDGTTGELVSDLVVA